MFNARLLKKKNLNSTGWMVIAVAGALTVLLIKQLSPAVTPPQPAPAATETAPAATAYLAEYDTAETPLAGADQPADDRSGWEMSLDVVLKLVVVLGLVYLAMHGLRWLQRHKVNGAPGGTTINVLETTGLAPGRSLHLVVVGEKTLLLGATDHQISVLAELADATIPVLEEETSFEQTLSQQAGPAETPLAPPLPIDDDAAEYTPDWQSTLNHLRSGIRQIRQVVGD